MIMCLWNRQKRIDRLVCESVIVIEQTYCVYHRSTCTPYDAKEAKSRCMIIIDLGLNNRDRRWLERHKDKDWLSRRVEYWVWRIKNGS